eukprot:TRINITY_DN328_c0_g1_i12.p6 TRINITY_DN328_c0_g1~~TRINITY_DN328_c0_g1_i12.p6  ORF type:complete len:117 (+),score=27.08 TRINITY_DN328_c0_g1_i12:3393-3743(+)
MDFTILLQAKRGARPSLASSPFEAPAAGTAPPCVAQLYRDCVNGVIEQRVTACQFLESMVEMAQQYVSNRELWALYYRTPPVGSSPPAITVGSTCTNTMSVTPPSPSKFSPLATPM